MRQLTEEELNLCMHYLNVIDSTAEGFNYVISSFTDFSKTMGDQIINDIFQALSSIAYANTVLEEIFAADVSIQSMILEF